MEQENKMTIEEASVNFGYVKKELEEEFEFTENHYKVASTYENIFGETAKEQRNNLDILIGFLDDDIIMKSETGTIKLEDVKEENENVMRRNMELFQSEIIQCDCCKVWLEKEEHLESHMLHCLENYNRLSHNLPGFRPTKTGEEGTVRGSVEISPSIDVDAGHSIPSTEIIYSERSCGIDCRAHRKDHFHGDHVETTDSCTSECSYQISYKHLLRSHLNTHTDIKAFECDICKKGFTQKNHLKQHIQIRHSNTHIDIKPKSFECDICKKGYSQKQSLRYHLRNHHLNTNEKEYKCSECPHQTNDKCNFKRHLDTHNDIKPFECDICKKGFTEKGSLKKHIQIKHSNTHTDIKAFECDICKKSFNYKSSLNKHVRNHHSNSSEKEYKCSECHYQTNDKRNFKQHLNTHMDIKAFECDICKKGFTEKGSLKGHIRNHHSNTSEKEYKCSECSYQTNDKRNFKRHLKRHMDIKSFECDICKKGYTEKFSLKRHIRTQHSNTSEKEYKCSECSYQTNDISCLQRHLNIHTDIKSFECDICKKGFTRKDSLKQHIIATHSHILEDIKPFECDICKNRFTRKSSLRVHIRRQHSNSSEDQYKCSECSYQTDHKGHFNQHLDTHTDIKLFECDICKKGFTRKSNLRVHIRNQHSNSSE